MTAFEPLLQRWRERPEWAVRDIACLACAFAPLFSVAWSFLNYHNRRPVARGRRSAVDTATMMLFFWAFSVLLARGIGAVHGTPRLLEIAAIGTGLCLMATGCMVNVVGRWQLGATWANQIQIYEGHKLMETGMFSLVRHPLYASLIWMFLGAGVAYLNGAALAATCLVFVPMMFYRARQEEKILAEVFPQYDAYRKRTGMFIPRLTNMK